MAAKKLLLTLFMFVLFTAAAAAAPAARSAAQGLSAATVDMSAEEKKDDKDAVHKKKPPLKNVQPKQTIQKKEQFNVQKKQQNLQKLKQQKVKQQPNIQIQEKVIVAPNVTVQKKFTGQPKKFTPKSNQLVHKFKLKGANQAFVNGQNYSLFRRSYRVRHNRSWRTFVALGMLAPLLIGAYEYYPYAYVDVPGPYCEGLTEDGCVLVYDEVETLEGDVIPQCVAYCPWQ